MAAIFISGTGTDVGKTYVTAALVRALVSAERPVEVLKPVVSGFDPAAPAGSDPAVLLEAAGVAWSPEALNHISPWRFRAPLSPPLAARLEGQTLEAQPVFDLCRRRVEAASDRLLMIEGAGGIMSPISDSLTHLDMAQALNLPVLLVAGSYLGTISHTLTAALALASVGISIFGVVISESPEAPPMADTLEALKQFIGATPVYTVSRGGDAPSDLVARLEA